MNPNEETFADGLRESQDPCYGCEWFEECHGGIE